MHFYQIIVKQNIIIFAIYVDDVLVKYNPHDIEEINVLKHNLLSRFRGNDLGSIDEILAINVITKSLKLCQKRVYYSNAEAF